MKNKNIIPVVFVFDYNFLIPTMVTIFSMLESADENTFYDIFLLIKEINFKNKEYLRIEKLKAKKIKFQLSCSRYQRQL